MGSRTRTPADSEFLVDMSVVFINAANLHHQPVRVRNVPRSLLQEGYVEDLDLYLKTTFKAAFDLPLDTATLEVYHVCHSFAFIFLVAESDARSLEK